MALQGQGILVSAANGLGLQPIERVLDCESPLAHLSLLWVEFHSRVLRQPFAVLRTALSRLTGSTCGVPKVA